jgi:hypothetical protein
MPGFDIDPFAGRKAKQPEVIEDAKATIDEVVNTLFKLFGGCEEYRGDDYHKALNRNVPKPIQIDLLLQKIKKERDWNIANEMGCNWYLSMLIQMSYDAGHNDFEL